MTINDLESRLNIQTADKITNLTRIANTHQQNYQILHKKYNKLKRAVLEKNKTELSQHNLSVNQSSIPNFSNISFETDVSVHHSSKHRGLESLLKPNLKPDDSLSHLQNENLLLKNSLQGVSRKVDTLLRENDELKTETNRNAYVLRV